jgi:hypothetical protein
LLKFISGANSFIFCSNTFTNICVCYNSLHTLHYKCIAMIFLLWLDSNLDDLFMSCARCHCTTPTVCLFITKQPEARNKAIFTELCINYFKINHRKFLLLNTLLFIGKCSWIVEQGPACNFPLSKRLLGWVIDVIFHLKKSFISCLFPTATPNPIKILTKMIRIIQRFSNFPHLK